MLAEPVGEPVSDPEDPAERSDVLAEDQDPLIAGQAVGQGPLSAPAMVTGSAPRATVRVSSAAASISVIASVFHLAEQRRPLLLQGNGRPGVHVGEQFGGINVRVAVHAVTDPFGQLLGLGRQVIGGLAVEQAFYLEVRLEPDDRVAGQPGLDLAVGPVASSVIGVGVRLDAIGDRLDQGRPWPAPRSMQARTAE